MKRARARVKALTGRSRVGIELEEIITALSLFLRGWGDYFRTGNSAQKFRHLDRHVAWRLHRLLIKEVLGMLGVEAPGMMDVSPVELGVGSR